MSPANCFFRIIVLLFSGLLFFNDAIAFSLTPKEQNGLWGYVDEKGKWKIKPQYHQAGEFNSGLACVMNYFNHNASIVKLYGYIDEQGKVKIPQVYNYASDFNNGLAVVGKWKGTLTIRQSKHSINGLKNDLAEMQVIDVAGNVSKVTEAPNYVDITSSHEVIMFRLSDGVLRSVVMPRAELSSMIKSKRIVKISYTNEYEVEVDQKHELTSSGLTGDIITAIKSANSIDTQLFKWRSNGTEIVFCPSDESLPRVLYKTYHPSRVNLVSAADTLGMFGFKNTAGNWIVPASFDYVEKTPSDNYWFTHGYKGWGVVDSIGNIVIEPQFDEIRPVNRFVYNSTKGNYENDTHSYSAFQIKQNNLWGIINLKGELLLPQKFDDIRSLSYDIYNDSIPFYLSIKDGKRGLLNTYFEELIPPREGIMEEYNRRLNLVRYSHDGLITYCDTLGNNIISGKAFKPVHDPNRFLFKKNDKWGISDRNGHVIVPDTCVDIRETPYIYYVIVNRNNTHEAINRNGERILPNPVFKITQHLLQGLLEVQLKPDSQFLTYYKSTGEQLKYKSGKPILGLLDQKVGRYCIGEYESILTPNGYVYVHPIKGDVFEDKAYYQIVSIKNDANKVMALFYNDKGETMMDIINYNNGRITYSGYYDGRE